MLGRIKISEVLKLKVVTRGTSQKLEEQPFGTAALLFPLSCGATHLAIYLVVGYSVTPCDRYGRVRSISGATGNDRATICREGSALVMIPENVARST